MNSMSVLFFFNYSSAAVVTGWKRSELSGNEMIIRKRSDSLAVVPLRLRLS